MIQTPFKLLRMCSIVQRSKVWCASLVACYHKQWPVNLKKYNTKSVCVLFRFSFSCALLLTHLEWWTMRTSNQNNCLISLFAGHTLESFWCSWTPLTKATQYCRFSRSVDTLTRLNVKQSYWNLWTQYKFNGSKWTMKKLAENVRFSSHFEIDFDFKYFFSNSDVLRKWSQHF